MSKNGKHKTQRCQITFKDDDKGGFTAAITFEPSIKDREENSPCLNGAAKVWAWMQSATLEELGKPIGDIGQPKGLIILPEQR